MPTYNDTFIRSQCIGHLADNLRELLPVDPEYRAECCEPDEVEPSMDARIRVRFDLDAWYFSTGDSSYEQDHRGSWGSTVLTHETTPEECDAIAREMWEEAELEEI